MTHEPASSPTPFQLVAGSPVLDFINTLDDRFTEPRELLASYSELIRFTHQSGLLSDRRWRKLKRLAAQAEIDPFQVKIKSRPLAVLARTIKFRELLADVTYGLLNGSPSALREEHLTQLEVFFKEASIHRCLKLEDGKLSWSWQSLSRHLESPLWLLSQAASDLLTSPDILRLRACASETCRWLFLDTSKNHSRRWCDMKLCGNRSKVRRFQARTSSSSNILFKRYP